MFVDKRSSERIARKSRVTLALYPLSQKNGLPVSMEARLVDVSRGGLCAEMPITLEKGESVKIRMKFEAGHIVSQNLLGFESDGVVRWSRNEPERGQCRMGIEFQNTSKANREAWLFFIGRARASLF